MIKQRADQVLVSLGLADSRSQAANLIDLGFVALGNTTLTKAGLLINEREFKNLKVTNKDNYVSRAAYKLASVHQTLNIDFKNKIVLDVGSSSGGFSEYALKQGALKVVSVEIGSDQMNPKLKLEPKLELHEHTDIRKFTPKQIPDIVLIDVSFISLREILPHIASITSRSSTTLAMVKPQFEASSEGYKHKGVVKNEAIRRTIFKNFEEWVKRYFIILGKADSLVSGSKGNKERFYLLRKV